MREEIDVPDEAKVISRKMRSDVAKGLLVLFGAFLVLLFAAMFTTGCASTQTWFDRAQKLTADSVSAHTTVLTIAGTAYRTQALFCEEKACKQWTISYQSSVEVRRTCISTDATVLYQCMLPANNARTHIETAATAYREVAEGVLLATSWSDVVRMLPPLRDAAERLASAASEQPGVVEQDALALLRAPIDAAEGVDQ